MPNPQNTTNPFHDFMKLGDAHLQVNVNCARCNKPVQNGESHTCNTTLEKEQTNEQRLDEEPF